MQWNLHARDRSPSRVRRIAWPCAALLFVAAMPLHAQTTPAPATQAAGGTSMEVYGFAMLDIGLNFDTIHPNWFDTMRVTKLPTFEGEFGEDGVAFAGVRQTRLGVKTSTPTSLGAFTTIFEFEMFGVGVDEGQTTIRLRHAWGEVGAFGAGQTWSPFMDPDVFPNSMEYWGPTGMVFYRNVQFRWMPLRGNQSLWIALERPGASGDAGVFAGRVELEDVNGRSPAPDLTAAYKFSRDWGYVRAGGAWRRLQWDDALDDGFELAGHDNGWGLNLSSNLNIGRSVVRLQYVFGEGIQNYMNDSPIDVGIQSNPGNAATPVIGVPLGITGSVVFVDTRWSDKYSTTIGYSRQDIDNSDLQAADAFKTAQYALGNVAYYPVQNVMLGGELQWGRRESFRDDFISDCFKIQFSFKYNFSHKFGG
jgi:hypothetical protein